MAPAICFSVRTLFPSLGEENLGCVLGVLVYSQWAAVSVRNVQT